MFASLFLNAHDGIGGMVILRSKNAQGKSSPGGEDSGEGECQFYNRSSEG